MDKINVLGVLINNTDLKSAYQQVGDCLDNKNKILIFTPNPEIILHAHANDEYREVLNSADLQLPDGFGLRLCTRIQHTVKGSDFSEALVSMADKKKLSILCVVRKDGLSSGDEIKQKLISKAPNAVIHILEIKKESIDSTDINYINSLNPNIVMVGLGFPEQEIWLANYFKKIKLSYVGIGVGGTFDFWTSKAKRAPHILRNVGMEWLWRLITEPRRAKRIFNAVVKFPIIVFIDKLRS